MKTFRIFNILLIGVFSALLFIISCQNMVQEESTTLNDNNTGHSFAKVPPLSGAIFTTDENGTLVNGNIYQEKCDVYLDGGPGPNAPATAAGLPDGQYYFQVTDPSGKVLLSTDPVEDRHFRVAGGIIVEELGTHNTGIDIDQGALTIQLCPFDDTPNPGGVYKVWVTRIEDFVGDITLVDNGYSPNYFHGFIPAYCKTDNFKIGKKGRLPCLKLNYAIWYQGLML
jgi:hypothetical protein